MPRPFAAYLRVYEPVVALGDPPDERLLEAVEAARLDRSAAGQREHALWLKSQHVGRLLPAELADGRAAPSLITDVLVLDPEDVPEGEHGDAGPGPLVCPLEMRARSAAALVTFLGDAHPALKNAVLDAGGIPADAIRARATATIGDLTASASHTLTTTWTVPLPWFVLFDPGMRRVKLGKGRYDPEREVSWRVPISDARHRAREVGDLLEATFGDSGPGRVLLETRRWLDNFDAGSAVELDYGGLVQLFADSILQADTTAEEVHDILDALRTGNVDELAELFADLRDFWGDLASRERAN